MTASFSGSKGGGGSFKQRPDTLRSNDVFEGLLGICAGPIEGLERGLKSLKLNGTPIEDASGNLNFPDMVANLLDGDPALYPQPIKLNLGGGGVPTNVNLTLGNANAEGGAPGDWATKSISNLNADFLDLRFVAQQLFSQDASGIGNITANIEIQMKPTGMTNWVNPNLSTPDSVYNPFANGILTADGIIYVAEKLFDVGGNWLPDPNSGYLSINGKTTSSFVKEYRVKVPNEGTYANKSWDVRARLIEPASVDADPIMKKRSILWESISAGYTDELGVTPAWRGVSTLQIMGKATDTFTGDPRIEGVYKTKRVLVPPISVYDPETRQYTGAFWDGSFSRAYTNDPAWVINDVLSDGIFGMSSLCPGSYLNKWDALEVSKWCSALVSDGAGGTHPRYSLNFKSEAPQKAKEFVQFLAGAVGGFAWDNGNGEWRIKLDKPEAATDIVTLDTIEGEFSYSHTDVSTRYNDITVTFPNAEMDYVQDRVRVVDQDSINTYGRKPTTIVGVGCTNRQEAVRRGALRLAACQNETRMVSYTTNRRGRLLTPFSTVLIADGDLGTTDTSTNRTTGRVVSTNGPRTQITLRDTVRLEVGVAYALNFTIPNPSYNPDATTQPDDTWDQPTLAVTRQIINSAGQRGDVRDLYLDNALPANMPEFLAVAIEAANLPTTPKMYRVLGLTPDEQEPERVTINAIEVDTGKWAYADAATAGEVVYEAPDSVVPMPLPPSSGSILTVLRVPGVAADIITLAFNWQRPASKFLAGFRVQYRLNGGPFIVAVDNLQDTGFEMVNPPTGLYSVEISSRDRRGNYSEPLVASVYVDSNVGAYLNFRNAWAAGTDYVVGDIVTFGGASYRSLSIHTAAVGNEPTVSADWEVFAASGQSGLIGFLTNENHTLPADSTGEVSTYAGANGTFVIYSGLDDVSTNFSLSTVSNPQVLTIGYAGRAFTVSGGLDAGEPLATVTIRATGSGLFAGVLLDKVFSLSKSQQGSDGAAAKLLTISSDRQIIAYTGTGAASPTVQTTTFTANKQNTTATVSWTISDMAGLPRTPVSTYLSSATGDSVTMTESQFDAARAGTTGVIVTATATDGTVLTDKLSVMRVAAGAAGSPGSPGSPGTPGTNGTAAVSLQMSRRSLPLWSYADGSVPSFTDAAGQLQVTAGQTDVTAASVLTASGSGLTGTINNANNSPVAGQPKGWYQVTAMSADVGALSLSATYNGVTYTELFTISKIKAGFEIIDDLPLPTTNLFVGREVFVRSNQTKYVYTSTGWSTNVKASDIVDQLQGAQIADGAVSSPKLAIGVGSNLLSGTLPGTNPNKFFTLTSNPDGVEYHSGPYGYVLSTMNSPFGGPAMVDEAWTPPDYSTFYIRQPNTTTGAQGFTDFQFGRPVDLSGTISNVWPIESGKSYEFSLYTGAHRCKASVFISWLDAAGAPLGITTVADENDEAAAGGTTLNQFKRLVTRGTAPAGARSAWVVVRKFHTKTGQDDSYLFMNRPMFAETTVNATTTMPWNPPAQGLFSAENILFGSMKGDRLLANSVGAEKLTIGNRQVYGQDFNFRYNPNNGRLEWDAGAIFWTDDAGAPQFTGVAAGFATWPGDGNYIHLYWTKGATSLSITTSPTVGLGTNQVEVCQWSGGGIIVNRIGATILDGGRIMTDTLDANIIKGGTITGAKLASTELISLSAQIGTLTVDTLHLKNNAISDIAYAYTDGYMTLAPTAWNSVRTLSFTSVGAPLLVSMNCLLKVDHPSGAYEQFEIRLLRNSAGVVGGIMAQIQTGVPIGGVSTGMSLVSFQIVDQPGVGTYTYDLQVFPGGYSSTGSSAGKRMITKTELKK